MSTHSDHDHEEHLTGPEQRKRIWKVFFILFAITAVEFLIAFTVERGFLRNTTFIVMTLVKAGFIVGEFMHLKHEVKHLLFTILLPLLFVVWLIIALLVEGTFYLNGWFG